MKRIILACVGLLYTLTFSSQAQVAVGEKGKLKGKVFSDYYWIAQNNNNDIVNQNGFWFRRIYLTYERKFSDSFSSRLRFSTSNPGDFQSSSKMVPSVKDAYLKWNNGQHQILAGISSTPTWGLVEDIWGYRSVEKSPLDLHDFGSSRDMGLSFKGSIDEGGKLNYHFFVGNGNSNKTELDKGKKLMLSLGYEITEHFVVEVYGDWNDTADNPSKTDSQTLQFFAGYRSDDFNFGALYANQHRNGSFIGGASTEVELVSAFTNMAFSDNVNGFLRADHMFDPYAGGSSNSYIPFAETAESIFIVGGVDFKLDDNIRLMPNLEAIVYSDPIVGPELDPDLIPRLTLYYKF
ncbi:porin [Fodinibius halophilus]|uniref:Porin n=1 Tax=Fodinibius halophilus TaxID=1736908 RepID=A0A6M1TGQ1_9BACT|nr:porin [Fodinibius halophilus]NGP89944.1 hypothetical protein [Fodinibius halophilus]